MTDDMVEALKLLIDAAEAADHEQRIRYLEWALAMTIQRVCQLEAERDANRTTENPDVPTLPL